MRGPICLPSPDWYKSSTLEVHVPWVGNRTKQATSRGGTRSWPRRGPLGLSARSAPGAAFRAALLHAGPWRTVSLTWTVRTAAHYSWPARPGPTVGVFLRPEASAPGPSRSGASAEKARRFPLGPLGPRVVLNTSARAGNHGRS